MDSYEHEDKSIYRVVVNHEEQYSIWPVDSELPLGWKEEGTKGLKDECLDHINKVWTDMKPLSLRLKMEAMARQADDVAVSHETAASEEPQQDDLVQRLARGDHPVLASRVNGSAKKLEECINRGYVIVKFTDTKGGTEFGIQLDKGKTNLSHTDFERGQGTVHLEGGLTLNNVKVRCVADIDLQALEGKGHLDILQ
jgi:uncharacterized protein YbdZ (MbtH family)